MYFNDLISIDWEQPRHKFGGFLKRKVKWFANVNYEYGGIEQTPCTNWHPSLLKLMNLINNKYNVNMNSALLNLYDQEHHCVNFHSDDEKIFGDEPNIFSISLGGERDFVLAKKYSIKMRFMAPKK